MNLDVRTLAFIISLTYIAQAVAIFVQYRVDIARRGIRWWLLGSVLIALGSVLMLTLSVKHLAILARFANPLVILGHVFLYIGVTRFLDRKENKKLLVSLYVVFILFYVHYLASYSAIRERTIVVSIALAIFPLMNAHILLTRHGRHIAGSARFTAIIFLIFGGFSAVRSVVTILGPSMQSYTEFPPIHIFGYINPIIAGILWTFGFIMMVNQQLNAENKKESEKFQLVFNTSPDAAVITRLSDGRFIDVNKGFSLISGYTREEVIGRSTIEIDIWPNIEDRNCFLSEVKDKGFCENKEFVFQRKDGSHFFGIISARSLLVHDQPHILSVVRDITEQKKAADALHESEETYRSILKASPDDITITDLQGRILMVSQAAKKMFGYDMDFEDFGNMNYTDFIVPEDLERAIASIRRMITGRYVKTGEYRGVRKDGSIFDIEVNSGLVRGKDGQPTKMIIIVRDISARKQAEQKIKELVQQLEIEKNAAQLNSITDSLTGLANRRYFDDSIRNEFFRLKRSGAPLSIIMLDVDHFKKFNDTYGHVAGDDCLRRIGSVLKAIVKRPSDVLARYGGEEFVVILPETEGHGASALAEKIRKTVEYLAIPHSASDASEYVTISLGVITARITGQDSPDQIVALADQALYEAKQKGRNQVSVAGG